MKSHISQTVRITYWKVRLSFLFVGSMLLLLGTWLVFLDDFHQRPDRKEVPEVLELMALGRPEAEMDDHQEQPNFGDAPAVFLVSLSATPLWLGGVSIVVGVSLLTFSFVVGGGTKFLKSRFEDLE